MQDRKLLEVTVITDDSTGCYGVGDMDFGIPYSTTEWLKNGDNRKKLADWLMWLSEKCRNSEPPFSPRMDISILAPTEKPK